MAKYVPWLLSLLKHKECLALSCGFLACVKLESPFNKSAEKMLIYTTILDGHIEFGTLVDQVDVTTC